MKCFICGSYSIEILFRKKGKDDKIYSILHCKDCDVVQTYPQPSSTKELYNEDYFTKRTDRGYNQYLSDKTKNQLLNVWKLNLKDLNFYKIEKQIFINNSRPTLLEIGSAAGFFLEYMSRRNWEVTGIELSESMVDYAKNQLNLNVVHGDFLETKFHHQFDCVVSWATIEHLTNPLKVFEKISYILKENGIFILSTCRWGILSKIQKESWRFMNVPEHLFFFNETQLDRILRSYGFRRISMITYGSGLTAKKNMSYFYKISKIILDRLVKILNMGDMMALMYIKK